MVSAAYPHVRHRHRLAAVGAVALTTLTVGTVGASPQALGASGGGTVAVALQDRRAQAPGLTGLGAGISPRSNAHTSPRSPLPGFLLDRGRYTGFEAPDPNVQLAPVGINDRGQIVGEYIRGRDESGFLRDGRGRITRFDIPGAQGTEAAAINNRGQIVGTYSQDTPIVNDSARSRGYLLDRGKVTKIDVPGAASTGAVGINDRGQVVGGYTDAAGRDHGFLWDKGRFVTIDVPGSAASTALDINNHGQILGAHGDRIGAGASTLHGFLLSRGVYRSFDAPGVPITQASGVNDRGQIVGFTASDADLTETHGFLLRDGIKGPFTPVDFPGAPNTAAFGVNDRGQIVGIYQNPSVTPSPQPTGTPPPMGGMS
jgi:probable HAF family extracellular repeat protein